MRIPFLSFVFSVGLYAVAPAAVIDFNDFENGDVVGSFFVGGGVTAVVTVDAPNNIDKAVALDTRLSANNDPDLRAPFTDTDGVGPVLTGDDVQIALIIQENNDRLPNGNFEPDDEGDGGKIIIDFVGGTVNFGGFTFLDDETVTVTPEINGVSGLASVTASSSADNFYKKIELGTPWTEVSRLTFDFGTNSGAIDDLILSVVPVPAALPLLVTALGGIGFATRRRRRG